MKSKMICTLLTAVLCIAVFCVPASASELPERFSITTDWMAADQLRIEVRDNQTGTTQSIDLRLGQEAENAETITIQVVDAEGTTSGTITIPNPNYQPPVPVETDTTPLPHEDDDSDSVAVEDTDEDAVPADPTGNPFTPDGTSGVLDNATEQDGKEFFTITTEAGNEFFIVIDRQKTADNVYLLNSVTENDLMALAEPGDGEDKIPSVTDPPKEDAESSPSPEPESSPPPEETAKNDSTGTLIPIVLAVLAVGGIAYYLKIVRPKRQRADSYGDDDDDAGEDYDSTDYEDETGEEDAE